MSSLGVIQRKLRAVLELPAGTKVPMISVVIAEDITEPENNSQFDERLAAGAAGQTPDALEFANVMLFNPANSGVLVVLREIWASGDTGSVLSLARLDAAHAAASSSIGFRDSRVSGSPASTLTTATEASGLGAPILIQLLVESSVVKLIPVGVILGPGTGLNLFGQVDVIVRTSWYWTEKALPNV